jgi:hypothetical protein
MKYFLMSRKFNKHNPEDFGLCKNECGELFLMSDRAVWKPRQLYDFGWGQENGFYRTPILAFEELFSLGVESHDEDNVFGAAIVLTEDYAEELLVKLENLIRGPIADIARYRKFFEVLKLDLPYNRCSTIGKSVSEINKDFERWKKIAEYVSNIWQNISWHRS